MKKINYIFLGSGRCFHTEDWYFCAKSVEHEERINVHFVSDQFEGEGQKSFLKSTDSVYSLINIDRFLPTRVTNLGNKWRNIIKLALLPFQAFKLRRILGAIDGSIIIHAHSTYYGFLASLSGKAYVSTPQGSEVLVRLQSKFYRFFARRAHGKATLVTVDSSAMKNNLSNVLGINSTVIQNGINVSKLMLSSQSPARKDKIVSMRGIAPNYRILELVAEFGNIKNEDLFLCAPFLEADYYEKVKNIAADNVHLLSQLSRNEYHQLLNATKVVVSIPISDSSPRSVYEAIFSGAVALCVYHPYIDELPISMRSRVVIVDLDQPSWLEKALQEATELLETGFVPCSESLINYDQMHSMRRVICFAKEFINE